MKVVRLLASATLLAAVLTPSGSAAASAAPGTAAAPPRPRRARSPCSPTTSPACPNHLQRRPGDEHPADRRAARRRYDIVHVQEDFNYHADLYATDRTRTAPRPAAGVPFGSGLNTLSNFPYSDFARVKWNSCNGTDCLTPKGFTAQPDPAGRGRLRRPLQRPPQRRHAPTPTSPPGGPTSASSPRTSRPTRPATRWSLMGDLNTRYTRTGDNIRDLVAANGLTDVWVQQERGGTPPAAGDPALVCDPANVTDACEVVDKILYRGNRLVRLTSTRYHNEHARFLDPDGGAALRPLPARRLVRLDPAPDLRASDTWGGPHGTPFTDADRVGPAVTRRHPARWLPARRRRGRPRRRRPAAPRRHRRDRDQPHPGRPASGSPRSP